MSVFREIAKDLDWGFYEVDRDTIAPSGGRSSILFSHSSRFPDAVFEMPVKAVRVVRDPRDMVISGAHYHAKGMEDWLFDQRDMFGGRSYFDAINELEDVQEK